MKILTEPKLKKAAYTLTSEQYLELMKLSIKPPYPPESELNELNDLDELNELKAKAAKAIEAIKGLNDAYMADTESKPKPKPKKLTAKEYFKKYISPYYAKDAKNSNVDKIEKLWEIDDLSKYDDYKKYGKVENDDYKKYGKVEKLWWDADDYEKYNILKSDLQAKQEAKQAKDPNIAKLTAKAKAKAQLLTTKIIEEEEAINEAGALDNISMLKEAINEAHMLNETLNIKTKKPVPKKEQILVGIKLTLLAAVAQIDEALFYTKNNTNHSTTPMTNQIAIHISEINKLLKSLEKLGNEGNEDNEDNDSKGDVVTVF